VLYLRFCFHFFGEASARDLILTHPLLCHFFLSRSLFTLFHFPFFCSRISADALPLAPIFVLEVAQPCGRLRPIGLPVLLSKRMIPFASAQFSLPLRTLPSPGEWPTSLKRHSFFSLVPPPLPVGVSSFFYLERHRLSFDVVCS